MSQEHYCAQLCEDGTISVGELVGPFPSYDEAEAYGKKHFFGDGDDEAAEELEEDDWGRHSLDGEAYFQVLTLTPPKK